MRLTTAVLTLPLMLVFAACGSPTQHDAGTADSKPGAARQLGAENGAGVAWLTGSFDEALAQARAESKPVFVLWSAAWCPHCHHLENQILERPEFIAASRRLIAFHLDADAAGAQIVGEKLDTQGYPTVILLDSQGHELMRISSDTPIADYVRVLETVIAKPRPIEEVLGAVRGAAPGQADPSDLNLLASYAWDQDSRLKLLPQETPALFKNLHDATPAELKVEKSRFLLLWLGSIALGDGPGKAAAPPLGEPERVAARSAVVAVLGDPTLRRANLGAFFGAGDAIVRLLAPAPGAERDVLVAAWEQAARELETDTELSTDDRLSALSPQLDLARLDTGKNAPLPAPLVEHVRERVGWAADHVTDPGELQTVLNTQASLLEQAGLGAEVQPLLERKMGATTAPYYFMSWLGSVRAQAGDKDGAITWARKAYDTAQGRYTRFRWGSTYLRQLMKLKRDDIPAIEASSREVLTELLGFDDAFAGSNLSRLEQLAKTYDEWAIEAAQASVVASLRDFVHAQCQRFPAEGEKSQQQRCMAFLADA